MQYVGIDWAYRRAAWCVRTRSGEIRNEGVVPADEEGWRSSCWRSKRT